MKRKSLIILIAVLLFGCGLGINEKEDLCLRIPGEFEPQNAVWLGYRTLRSIGEYDSVSDEIIKALNPHIQINLIIENDTLLREEKAYFNKLGVDTSKIDIFIQSPTDDWYRDPGPIFGITPKGELAIADFKYTSYENVFPDSIGELAAQHEAIDRNVADRLGVPVVASIVAMEGGAFETNGKGSLIQCEEITLRRNPHLSKEDIEEDFRKNFGITNVIWLPAGAVEDPHNFMQISDEYWGFGTGGHTDEFVRFANDSTILLAWIDEREKEDHLILSMNYKVFSKNYEILKQSRNENGKTFNIIKVPQPEPDFYQWVFDTSYYSSDDIIEYYLELGVSPGDSFNLVYASSYLNYIISNGVVIIPEYWSDGKSLKVKNKDEVVRAIFETLYPDREIIGINPLVLNRDGGGMHCRYQSEPLINEK